MYRLAHGNYPCRNRDNLEAGERKIEYVAPEELCAAIHRVADDNIDVGLEELISESIQVFGFKRATQKTSEYVEASIQPMVNQGMLNLVDGAYRALHPGYLNI